MMIKVFQISLVLNVEVKRKTTFVTLKTLSEQFLYLAVEGTRTHLFGQNILNLIYIFMHSPVLLGTLC